MLEDVLDYPERANLRKLDIQFLAELTGHGLYPRFAKAQAPPKGRTPTGVPSSRVISAERKVLPFQGRPKVVTRIKAGGRQEAGVEISGSSVACSLGERGRCQVAA